MTAVIATAGVVSYLSSSSSSTLTDEENNKNNKTKNISSTVTISSQKLVYIRQQFDAASLQIFPTLRIKITEIVDVLQTIRQIKELRIKSDMAHNGNVETENQLWEEIKILSFTLWFTSIYATCATCLLLRIQLFLLARNENSLKQISREEFESLINDSYSHLFEKGIIDFVEVLKSFVTKSLSDCTVKDKTSYQYDEFNLFIMKARHYIERESKTLTLSLIMRKLIEIIYIVHFIM